MAGDLTANSSVVINAEPAAVWAALTEPELVSKAFFGAQVESDWQEGSPITFRGEWEGKPFEDKGRIVRIVPNSLLEYTHWSPLSGVADDPENYHGVTFRLTPREGGTGLSLSQSNVTDEAEREHSERNWSMMLDNVKRLVEQ